MYILQCHHDRTFEWLEFNDSGQCLSSSHHNSFTDLPKIPNNAALAILISGETVTVTRVKLPKLRRAELMQAAPYALEEQLASDPEQIIVAIGERLTNGDTCVGVMDKMQFEEQWLAWREHRLFPSIALPDFLALTRHENTWTIVLTDDRALVRIDDHFGFSIEIETLHVMLASCVEKYKKPEKIHCFQKNSVADIAQFEQYNIPVAYHDSESINFFDIKSVAENATLNFLQGKYRAKTKSSDIRQHWMRCGMTAGIFVAVLLLSQITQWIYFHYQVAKLQQQVLITYQQLFPGATTLLEPHFRTKKLLDQFQLAEKDSAFLRLLETSGKNLLYFPDIHLQSIQFDQHQLKLTVNATNIALLSDWTTKIRDANLSVKQQLLKTGKDAITAELTIWENAS